MSTRKRAMMIALAGQLLEANIREATGNNDGEIVAMFQRACDGKAVGEPWCQAALEWIRKVVEAQLAAMGNPEPAPQPYTEHCMTFWNATPKDRRGEYPQAGMRAYWRKRDTDSGHVGLVLAVNADGSFDTFEGNTSPGVGGDQRDGQGAYRRRRTREPMGDLELQGFAET